MRLPILLLFYLILSFCNAQTFTEVSGIENLESPRNNTLWLDIDNDDDYDLLRYDISQPVELLKNDNGEFTFQTEFGLPGLTEVIIAVADFNSDGVIDVFMSGKKNIDGYIVPHADIYLNNGSGIFEASHATGLAALVFGSADCSDFDHDGDADILVTGYDKNGKTQSYIVTNNGDLTFTIMTNVGLENKRGGYGLWGDYDGDNWDDILITEDPLNYTEPPGINNRLYHNNGDFTFSEVPLTIPINGRAAWIDVNHDGLEELFITGNDGADINPVSGVFTYDYQVGMVPLENIPFTDIQFDAFSWGDIDNNGYKDLLGYSPFDETVRIYLNSAGTFSLLENTEFPQCYSLSLGDIDKDEDLDIMIANSEENLSVKFAIKFFQNNTTNTNNAPGIPYNVDAIPSGVATLVRWTRPDDNESIYTVLTYAIRLGTTPGGSEIIAPPTSSSGFIRSDEGLLKYRYGFYLYNLPAGEYYFSVQAFDQSMRGSGFSEEYHFTVVANVLLAPKSVSARMLESDEVEITWYDQTYNENNFVIERSNDGSVFSVLGTTAKNTNIFIDETALTDHLYFYRVRVVADGDQENVSETLEFQTPPLGYFVRKNFFPTSDVRNNFSLSVASIDYDNDGDLDVLFTELEHDAELYSQDGAFTKIDANINASSGKSARTSNWGDYDNDGDLDVCLVDKGRNHLYKNTNGVFTEVLSPPFTTDLGEPFCVNWVDYNNDGFLDLFVGFADGFQLYQGSKTGTFTKVTGAFTALAGQIGLSLWCDFNDDGLQDLLIAGITSKSYLVKNMGGGIFQKVEDSAISDNFLDIINASWADYDGDGDFDLIVISLSESPEIFINDGKGVFTRANNVAIKSGIFPESCSWLDADNDGDNDLLLLGYFSQTLYLNDGNGDFVNAQERSLQTQMLGTQSMASGDYNKDGFLDVFLANNSYDNTVLLNNANDNHWISFNLVGVKSNRSAIGAKVRIKSGDKWQTTFVSSQSSRGSQNSLAVEFGLGEATLIDSVVVEWPGNDKQFLTNVPVDQFLTIKEDAVITSVQQEGERGISISPNPTNTFIQLGKLQKKAYNITLINCTGNQISHQHIEGVDDSLLNVSDQVTGLYILKVETEDKVLFYKIIKQ